MGNIIKAPPADLVDKVGYEYRQGLDYVKDRRGVFSDRLTMYNNQLKNKDMVGVMSMYTVMQVLLAVYYTDGVSVEFAGRQFGQDEILSNLEKLAAFDHEEMNLPVINYFSLWDKLFYGVGIRIFTDFDHKRLTPTVRSVSPMHWIPDPHGSIDTDYSFHGFEFQVEKNKLTKELGYNMDEVNKLEFTPTDEVETSRQAYQTAQGVTPQPVNLDKNFVSIYHHYTSYKDQKYLVTTGGDKTRVLRVVKLASSNNIERDNPKYTPFPIVLSYFSPSRYAPFGTSVADIVEDKQRVNSVLINLMIKKQKAALYPGGIYNARKIKNKRDLDFGLNKFIGVYLNPGESLGDVLRNHEKDLNDAGGFNLKDLLDSEMRLATGADVMQAGVLSSSMRTLGEVQNVQANANLRYLLHSRLNAWGEKEFWKYWYREYKINFNEGDKKILRVALPNTYQHAEFSKKDITTEEDPDIIIRSRLEAEKDRDKRLMEHLQILPMIMNNPAVSMSAKMEAQRTALRLGGRMKEEIDMLLPPTPDELDAQTENEFLSRNETVEVDASDDHMSHLNIHRRAENKVATQTHCAAHIQMYILSGERDEMKQQYQQYAESMQGQAAMAQNQVANQLVQSAGQANTPKTGPIPAP